MLKYKRYLIIAVAGVVYLALRQPLPDEAATAAEARANASLQQAFEERRTNYQIGGTGTVTRVLADDNDGSRHQRFVLAIDADHTLLVAHNIDLAPRIEPIAVGDVVSFYGEYEWNPQGGVIHWTHHDPDGDHVGGWLEHDGRRYQ